MSVPVKQLSRWALASLSASAQSVVSLTVPRSRRPLRSRDFRCLNPTRSKKNGSSRGPAKAWPPPAMAVGADAASVAGGRADGDGRAGPLGPASRGAGGPLDLEGLVVRAVAVGLAAAELDAICDIGTGVAVRVDLDLVQPALAEVGGLRVGRRGQRVDVQGDGRARRAAAPGVDVGDVEARVRRDERPVEVVGGADEQRAGTDRGDGTRHRDGRGRADDPGWRTHGSWLPPCGRTARVRRDEGVGSSRARVAHLVGRRDARRGHGRWAMGGPPPRTGGDPDVRRRVSRTRQVASDTQVPGGRMTGCPVGRGRAAAGSAGCRTGGSAGPQSCQMPTGGALGQLLTPLALGRCIVMQGTAASERDATGLDA